MSGVKAGDDPLFVPNGAAGSKQDTATVLVGTAREFDIDQHDIHMVRGGFRISQALADVLYDDGVEQEPEKSAEEPVKSAPKKAAPAKKTETKKKATAKKSSPSDTSSNRAAKTTGTDKE